MASGARALSGTLSPGSTPGRTALETGRGEAVRQSSWAVSAGGESSPFLSPDSSFGIYKTGSNRISTCQPQGGATLQPGPPS